MKVIDLKRSVFIVNEERKGLVKPTNVTTNVVYFMRYCYAYQGTDFDSQRSCSKIIGFNSMPAHSPLAVVFGAKMIASTDEELYLGIVRGSDGKVTKHLSSGAKAKPGIFLRRTINQSLMPQD